VIPAGVMSALGSSLEEWVGHLEAVPPSQVRWLDSKSAGRELEVLGVGSEDIDMVVATLPRMREEPFDWLLSRLLGWIEASMGDEQASWIGMPHLPADLGAPGRCFPIHLFLLGLPTAREYHRGHGVPAEVTRATMADLGRHVAIHRRMYGSTGVDAPGWMTLHLRGLLYECGRLQYEPARWRLPGDAGELELKRAYDAVIGAGGPRADEPVLSVHIPEGGQLSPDDVDRSLRAAEEFFGRSFPEPSRGFAVCTSWLLDEQLCAYLSEQSNILQFQRRFRLAPLWVNGDRDVLTFVFRRPDADPCHLPDVPQGSRLERAVVAHLRGGSHWRVRAGWLSLGRSVCAENLEVESRGNAVREMEEGAVAPWPSGTDPARGRCQTTARGVC